MWLLVNMLLKERPIKTQAALSNNPIKRSDGGGIVKETELPTSGKFSHKRFLPDDAVCWPMRSTDAMQGC